MKTRIVIYADEGKVLTDGTTYGKQIYLADGKNAESFREISENEYNELFGEAEDTADGLITE